MRVAIDYDGTFSANPGAWSAIIDILKSHGADVICITSRFPNAPIRMPVPVYYTCGQPKWEFACERGISIDIWVDDMPSCIGGPPEIVPGQVKIRRELVKKFIDSNFNAGPYETL